jgi:hypothetical protein
MYAKQVVSDVAKMYNVEHPEDHSSDEGEDEIRALADEPLSVLSRLSKGEIGPGIWAPSADSSMGNPSEMRSED